MKKTIVLLVAMLLSLHLSAQDRFNLDFSAFTRFDVAPVFPFNDNASVDLSNTAFNTLLIGDLGEHVTFCFQNKWASTSTPELYDDFFTGSWMRYGNVSVHFGGWEIKAGKQFLAIGEFEQDPFEFESHQEICTQFWYNYPVYVWGLGACYTLPSESSAFEFQVSASPFDDVPFQNGLLTWSGKWFGYYDNVETLWSATFTEFEKGSFVKTIAMGTSFKIGENQIILDFVNVASPSYGFFDQEQTFSASFFRHLSDKIDIRFRGGFERRLNTGDLFGEGEDWELCGMIPTGISRDKDYAFGGCALEYYPIQDSDRLRLHALVAANNYLDGISFNIGLLYNLNFHYSK